MQSRLANLTVERVAVLQHVDLRGRRRDAFFDDTRASQRVDERALAGIELADDDEQEKLVELLNRAIQGRLVLGRGAEAHEGRAKARQDLSFLSEELFLCFIEDFRQHRWGESIT